MPYPRRVIPLDFEIELIRLASLGCSSGEIGSIVGKPGRQVRRDLERIRNSRQLRTTEEVIALFKGLGYIKENYQLTAKRQELAAQHVRVVNLLLKGYGTRQIATELQLHPQTVCVYIHRAAQRYGVHNRHELTRILQTERMVLAFIADGRDLAFIAKHLGQKLKELQAYVAEVCQDHDVTSLDELRTVLQANS